MVHPQTRSDPDPAEFGQPSWVRGGPPRVGSSGWFTQEAWPKLGRIRIRLSLGVNRGSPRNSLGYWVVSGRGLNCPLHAQVLALQEGARAAG